MVTLALLRHAKAVKDDGGGDHARRLSPAGRADAAAVGTWLRGTLTEPVLVLASDARRTRETTELAFPAPRHGIELRWEQDLYGASPQDLVARIRALDQDGTVVLIGYNPGIGELAHRLAGAGDDAECRRLREGFPTSACAVLRFADGWTQVGPGLGHLIALHCREREE